MASQSSEIALSMTSPQPALETESAPAIASPSAIPAALLQELWLAADAESCSLTHEEFNAALLAVATKHNFGQPPEISSTASQEAAFYRALRLPDLALAQACALGRDVAWQRFLSLYRAPLTQAATAITGSATLGHDLADSLYAELFGLSERAGQRRSPLGSYSGRGSLLGWLRTTLAQRHIDHHRRTHRETPLDDLDAPAPNPVATPLPTELARLKQAIAHTFAELPPDDRFLLASYFIDQKTLLQISRILKVHEATVSRKLKRLTSDMQKQLLRNLQSSGLSKRAAEEALGADPRDLDINLGSLLQYSQSEPFHNQTSQPEPNQAAPDTQ